MAELIDVSIVTTPAYDGTDIGLRSYQDYKNSVASQNFSATQLRLRMKRDLELGVREYG